MGDVFLIPVIGSWLYSCRGCNANLASKRHLLDTNFKCWSGKGYFFKRVVNVICGEPVPKKMITGDYMIRYVYCKRCKTLLGWKYKSTERKILRYRIGKYVLEEALIAMKKGFKKPKLEKDKAKVKAK